MEAGSNRGPAAEKKFYGVSIRTNPIRLTSDGTWVKLTEEFT